MKSRADKSTQLLVVGAGPVGLLAALCASRAGIDVTILDQVERGFGRGHATILHPSTVRLLDELGLSGELTAKGKAVTSVAVHANGDPPSLLELPSPALAVPQAILEDTLCRALQRAGVPICAPVEASMLQQDGAEVRVRALRRELVTLGSPADYSEWQPVESFVVKARYAIGADGYESRVRSALGIDTASLGPTESFAMFECGTDAVLDGRMDIGFKDDLVSSSLPLANGRVRVGFQVVTELDAPADAARLGALAPEGAPWLPSGALSSVDWGTVTHFERRLVRRFGQGRVWLAGDAAHVTNPFGAQSMNIGLSEAVNLVERVAECLRRDGGTDSLRDYGLSCQREWYKLFGYHVKFELLPHAPNWLAKQARRIAPLLPVSGPDRSQLLAGLGLSID
ncbi:MAG TPA: NAD(P)/FAD-dependent oxidoreductase [Polyangiaceae bacterium]|nr:NAD(P)/FAD-dependent oxidoreductase [Polyangiaceae bacterium]